MNEQDNSKKEALWKFHLIYLLIIILLGGWIVYTQIKSKETNP